MISEIIAQIFNGLCFGMIIAIIALGLTLIFGWLEVINVAHGTLYTLGAVIAFFCFSSLGNWWFSLIGSPLFLCVIGMLIYLTVMKPAIHKKERFTVSLMVSYGVMFILEQTTLLEFGGVPESISMPITGSVALPYLGFYPIYRIFVVFLSMAVMGGVWYLLRSTKLGLQVRATKQDREMAVSMGINTERVFLLVFILGCALAGFAGALAAPITTVTHTMGRDIIIPAFLVVIVGGLGSFRGTILIAIIFSVVKGIMSVFVTPIMAEVVTYILIMGILYVYPEGICPEV